MIGGTGQRQKVHLFALGIIYLARRWWYFTIATSEGAMEHWGGLMDRLRFGLRGTDVLLAAQVHSVESCNNACILWLTI